jgi:hypothetical protein
LKTVRRLVKYGARVIFLTFIVLVISIKQTGIPMDIGEIPKQEIGFATVGADSSRDYRGWKPLPQIVIVPRFTIRFADN